MNEKDCSRTYNRIVQQAYDRIVQISPHWIGDDEDNLSIYEISTLSQWATEMNYQTSELLSILYTLISYE